MGVQQPGSLGTTTRLADNLFSSEAWKRGSPLVDAAWSGRLLHLSGLDVIGSTAGSLSRMLQDRETELWEGKRIVGSAADDEVCTQ